MKTSPALWHWRAFSFALLSAVQFPLLSTIAMLLYPGGTIADASAGSYRFFANFFSDLGLTVARDGANNLPSLLFFASSLALAGLGLMVYFVAAVGLFRHRPLALGLALLAAAAGVASGIGFIGVAFTPANLHGDAHITFVLLAFEAFLAAAVLLTAAMTAARGRWRREAFLFGAFTLLLAAYVWLLYNGPDLDSSRGLTVQVTGQKVIAYSAIGATALQAYWARQRVGAGRAAPTAPAPGP